ncbi:hypothetical protein Mgra_00001021, partial [Meloidogyne graminicola]
EQSFCLTKFLFKTYGNNNVIQQILNKTKNEANSLLLNYYKLKWKNNKYIFNWDWEKTKYPENPFPNVHFKENTLEFQELMKCNEIVGEGRLFK